MSHVLVHNPGEYSAQPYICTPHSINSKNHWVFTDATTLHNTKIKIPEELE